MKFILPLFVITSMLSAAPISLHPANPHYFLFHDKPMALITSAEHYGAVINLDFDYREYLDTLAAEGMNYTRIFSGAYVEPQGAFNIARNTLAPDTDKFLAPWPRNGEGKFDLTKYAPAYFERLRSFIAYASGKNIVVELVLFCPMYEEIQWSLSPMNAKNNLNDIGNISSTEVHTLDKSGPLLAIQEDLTRKLVTELNTFENLFFEIANEPYFGGITMAWQHRIADVIVETEKELPNKHLIAQNIANDTATIENPHPAISVFNFHYATPPEAVATNYGLNKVIGDDETGFRGTGDTAYRTEAWDFILAGGGLFNNLDYSFTAGHEDGTFEYPSTQPGGGNTGFRRQIKILSEFLHGFEFIYMKPDNGIIAGGIPPAGTARALVDPEKALAIYLRAEGSTGPWSARWTGFVVPPTTGEYQFHTFSNDGIRLWIDGRQIIDNWTDHGEKEDTGKAHLTAGNPVAITLEYFYNGGQGATKLWWTAPGSKKEPIPNDALRLPDKKGWGLHGDYFQGVDLKNSLAQRDDGQVNFAWGTTPPFPGQTASDEIALQLKLPPGTWSGAWIDTKSGTATAIPPTPGNGTRTFKAPAFQSDIALRLLRQNTK